MVVITQIINYLKSQYSLNLRALGLLRIGTGILILVDLFIRALSLKAHYSDEGVIPISVLKTYNWHPYYFSLHTLSGEVWWQIVLFCLNALFAILLIQGYKTRITSIVCWIFLVSLQNRNPFILQGGDDLLRLLLFWGIFLPWNKRYSKDAKHLSDEPDIYFSWSGIGYILLICSMYFFSALQKTSTEWHSEGSAIYYALSLDQISMPLGKLIYPCPTLLKYLTWLVYYTELLAPILILMPFKNRIFRAIGVCLIILLHIGFASCLYVGLFYAIGIVSVIGLFSGKTIVFLEKKIGITSSAYPLTTDIKTERSSLQLLIDMFCGLIISLCLLINLGNMSWFKYTLKSNLTNVVIALRLEQTWSMFAPTVFKDDGWYVYEGLSSNGKKYDLYRNKEGVDYSKPKNIVTMFESDRWRKFGEVYTNNNNNHMRPYYCKYLLSKWNTEHPTQLIANVTIYYMRETTLPNYTTNPLVKEVPCTCYLP